MFGARAIVVALCGAGCVLNLDDRGAVVISAVAPPETERVIATVSAGSSSAEFPIGEPRKIGVPVGPVVVVGEALRGSELLGRDEEVVEVAAGEVEEVVLELGDRAAQDGGVAEDGAVSADVRMPIDTTIRLRTDQISNSTLSGEGRTPEEAFALFYSMIDPASIRVESVSIERTGEPIDAFFDQDVTVALMSDDRSATRNIAAGDPTALTVLTDVDFSGLGLDTHRFWVTLRGHTSRTDDFDVDAIVTIVYSGR